MRSSICSSFSKIFLGNINIIKKFEKIHLVSNLLFFHRHKAKSMRPSRKDVANFIPFLHFAAIVSKPIYIPLETRAESLKDLI